MNEVTPQELHTVAGLLIAVLFVLFIAGKVFGKFLDDWWDKSKGRTIVNGNGETKKVCYMGQGGADRIIERMDAHHERLREIVHENHAAALAILMRLADALQQRTVAEQDISLTLKLIEKHLAGFDRD